MHWSEELVNSQLAISISPTWPMANTLAARGQQQIYDAIVVDQLSISQYRHSIRNKPPEAGPYLAAQGFQIRRINRPLEFRPELFALALVIAQRGIRVDVFFKLAKR